MKIQLGKDFNKRLAGRFGKYEFEVGVLNDGPHKWPSYGPMNKLAKESAPALGMFAGGPVRKIFRGTYQGKKDSGKTISEVSKSNRERLGFNYLSEPFKKKSSDIVRFSKSFFELAFGRTQKKRCENLLQAIVRNPILRGEYGPQSEMRKKVKGFDRPMIDTAQLFKALRAKVTERSK